MLRLIPFCSKFYFFITYYAPRLSVCCLLSLSFFIAQLAHADITKIVLPHHDKNTEYLSYFPRVLELAMKKTEATDGPYEITFHPYGFTSARTMAELKYGNTVNVVWSTLNEQRLHDLHAITIPLLKGLNSHRVFLIRKEDRQKFSAVHTLNDLRNFKAGQVSDWPDAAVLQNNDLPLVKTAHYELLFTMLAGKRFDYFPLGLYEIGEQQEKHENLDLVVEKHLMLHYPAPIYFFVNKANAALGDRIRRGLELAITDGSFDALFFSVPEFRKAFDEMRQKDRLIFDLDAEDFSGVGF